VAPVTVALPALAAWHAELELRFEARAGRTVLAHNRHAGPLVVQKALYPEGDRACHAVVLHPPGGIAGGDCLRIDATVGTHGHALLTTPGATRWYKSNRRTATQQVGLRAAPGAIVEWLPLETIVFDGADAESTLAVDLSGDARALGWDIVAYGRRAAGERYAHGRFRQSLEVRRDGRLLWAEYGEVGGEDPLFASPVGYAGRSVSGLFWACVPGIADEQVALCRDVDHDGAARMLCGITRLGDDVLLARCLADAVEPVRRYLERVWCLLRPGCAGIAPSLPRLWAT
jgi:urease accessory protein